jgi:general stress protein CsbA
LERCSRRATTIAAIGLTALGAAIVLVAVCFSRWGIFSPAIATVDALALIVGVLCLSKIDRRARVAIATANRAAQHVRDDAALFADGLAAVAADEKSETALSEAIATVDTIALTAGGIWLDKLGKPSRREVGTPRRSAKPAAQHVNRPFVSLSQHAGGVRSV